LTPHLAGSLQSVAVCGHSNLRQQEHRQRGGSDHGSHVASLVAVAVATLIVIIVVATTAIVIVISVASMVIIIIMATPVLIVVIPVAAMLIIIIATAMLMLIIIASLGRDYVGGKNCRESGTH
jgi:hypothetical protein